jgi:hypothetical protein
MIRGVLFALFVLPLCAQDSQHASDLAVAGCGELAEDYSALALLTESSLKTIVRLPSPQPKMSGQV